MNSNETDSYVDINEPVFTLSIVSKLSDIPIPCWETSEKGRICKNMDYRDCRVCRFPEEGYDDAILNIKAVYG